jgi:uncharacterized protein (TIGR04255 family)
MALGQMANAPLIYVLAHVVFTRIPNMAKHWDNFHESIFERYPKMNIEDITEFQVEKAESVKFISQRCHIRDTNEQEGLILSSDSLIFHTSSYTKSSDFFSKLEFVMTNLINILSSSNIETTRIGLRYVDLLLPGEDLPVEDQVSGKLGGISLDKAECDFLKLEEVTKYSTPQGGHLVIRHRQSKDADILPSDLFPNTLRHAERLNINKPKGAIVGLIDYDHYVLCADEFKSDVVINKIKEMRVTSSAAFKLIATPEAMDLWTKER